MAINRVLRHVAILLVIAPLWLVAILAGFVSMLLFGLNMPCLAIRARCLALGRFMLSGSH